jgi:transcriptional regulator with XRE-family HTH domain
MKIGQAIKLCRNQKGLSLSDLAKSANISVSYLSLLERDLRDPNLSTLQDISSALHVPISILMFLAGKDEILDVSPELAEKLSLVALKLMETSANEKTDL